MQVKSEEDLCEVYNDTTEADDKSIELLKKGSSNLARAKLQSAVPKSLGIASALELNKKLNLHSSSN